MADVVHSSSALLVWLMALPRNKKQAALGAQCVGDPQAAPLCAPTGTRFTLRALDRGPLQPLDYRLD